MLIISKMKEDLSVSGYDESGLSEDGRGQNEQGTVAVIWSEVAKKFVPYQQTIVKRAV